MATNNAVNQASPITVANGGTGNASLTAHTVLVGNGAAAITQLAVGTNGQALVGSTGADPAFATVASSDSSILFTTGAASLALAGRCIQQVFTSSATSTTTNVVIPTDNTIPQNTEGIQIMTLSITPKSASNMLYIYAVVPIGGPAAADDTFTAIALFQDSTANALAANAQDSGNVGQNRPVMALELEHIMTAGTTSATTFAIRVGVTTTGNTITINGYSGTRRYGGVEFAFMYIFELG
jgi:hypothetical protein